MSRHKNDGLKYFSLDTDFFYSDRRIKALRARFGSDGLIFFIYLLTEIYRNGYYIRWDDDAIDNAVADLNLTEGLIKQIMTFLVSRSLLMQISILGLPDTIITSPGIQKRYQESTKGLKREVCVDAQIWVLEEEETASFIKVIQNHVFSGRKDLKSGRKDLKSEEKDINKKKINEIKENDKKGKNTSVRDRTYYPDDEMLNQAFADYVDMRKQLKKPMTDRAIELAMKKLEKLAVVSFSDGNAMDHDLAIQILNQSVMNSWLGLFPLKDSQGGRGADNGRNDSLADSYRMIHDWATGGEG